MNSDSWPELSDWELNSWALLTAPDPGTSMGQQSLSSSTPNFPQSNFYDPPLISSDSHFQQNNPTVPSASITATSSDSRPSTSQPTTIHQPRSHPSRSKPSPNHPSPSSSTSPTSPSSKVHKRTLNTLAARRYRQKRVDQMAELEQKLKESEKEKEELQMRVARLEGEVEVLRGLLRPSK
jgi:Basic region leucine zipper